MLDILFLWWQVFDKLDVDRNGFLTADTIQNAVGQDFRCAPNPCLSIVFVFHAASSLPWTSTWF
jgi:hypothetical protein